MNYSDSTDWPAYQAYEDSKDHVFTAGTCPDRQVTTTTYGTRVTCPTHPAPPDTFLQSPQERAWYVSHVGPLPAQEHGGCGGTAPAYR